MLRKYEKESEIFDLVESFETARISREDWRHAEHLVVALYYLTHHEFDTAASKMRSGILNLLVTGFGVDLEKEMPYHETLTMFWMRTVFAFSLLRSELSLTEMANELVLAFDKDYPLRYYSREFLFSDEARAKFVSPDLAEAAAV